MKKVCSNTIFFRGVNRGDAGMYVCFVTSPRGGFNYRPAYLTVIPSKIKCARHFYDDFCIFTESGVNFEKDFEKEFAGTESLVNESPPVLILVICLSVSVIVFLIIGIFTTVFIFLIIGNTMFIMFTILSRWSCWES